ncbi:MAG: alanine dehydrogenase [Bacteroidota bacterium]|nr:alanine dehydrogenase [Bacteroidota bacterium]
MIEHGDELLGINPVETLKPLEETLELQRNKRCLAIGIPKDMSDNENRVPLTPDAVSLLVAHDHTVLIQSGAGIGAHYEDHKYSEAGAQIVSTPREVFQADIILKMSALSNEEIEMVRMRQTIMTSLQIPGLCEEYFRRLSAKKATALSYQLIKDRTKAFPIIRAMSEIAGNTCVLIASEYLSHPQYGRGVMLGGFSGISPTEVVILGAGTVGEFATRAALGMGAMVKVFDNSIYKLRRLQNNLNTRIYTSIIQPKVLSEVLLSADVIIGAIHSKEGRTPCYVTQDMVKRMKPGSLIIDVSIDQGGCVETSHVTDHNNPVFVKYGVTHYCVPNIASKVPHTASIALSNILLPMLLDVAAKGGLTELLKTDLGIRQGVYMYNGTVTNKFISDTFRLPFQDIDLLMSANFG